MVKRILAILLALVMALALAPTAALADSASGEYSAFNGHYYQVFEPDSITWEEAKQRCEQMGGYLATITSAEEQAFVDSLIENSGKNGLWLGAYRQQSDKEFVWLTGEPFQYTNWSAGQPDYSYQTEDMLMLYTYHNSQFGKWNDLTNEGWYDVPASKMGFICEWDSLGDLNDVPSLGEPSSIQGKVILKNQEEIAPWRERLDLPQYAQTLYDVVTGDKEGGKDSVFAVEQNFTLPEPAAAPEATQVDKIEVAEFDLYDLYAAPGAELNKAIFSDSSFYTIDANAEDRKIDCTKLAVGDVVTTSNFNGVYVTKIPYDSTFDTQKKEACEYIAAVYHAFDRDNPEIFWLSGKCKARIMIAADPATKAKEAYFFLVLADKDGFTMQAPDWTAAGSITAGIAQRDAAVAEILKTVTASDPAGKVKQLNKWITEHNQYNTTPDLTTISNEPHECLAALKGQVGTEGPVCDGYSRAFKVLCDKLDIPCVLETGWAKARANSTAGFHMWSLVQIGETWYGTDITWDDPTVSGFVGAKSGRENENYLLVGADTVINGLAFRQSHVVKNQAAVGGVDFNNGPVMGLQAYAGLAALPTVENIPATGTAVPAIQKVDLDGKAVEFQCYALKDAKGNLTNYVRIRDLALALNGTNAQFNVSWDGRASIIPNTAYQVAGGEGTTPYSGNQAYTAVSEIPVSFDGGPVNLTSFLLKDSAGNGYTYYKLRDLGQLLNFNVGWTAERGVFIETGKPYAG